MRTGRPSIQFAFAELSRPISGTRTIDGLPEPSMSATGTGWTVGSSAIGWMLHSSSSVLPRFSHCSVPPDLVLNGAQSAPSTRSRCVAVDVQCRDADVVRLGLPGDDCPALPRRV